MERAEGAGLTAYDTRNSRRQILFILSLLFLPVFLELFFLQFPLLPPCLFLGHFCSEDGVTQNSGILFGFLHRNRLIVPWMSVKAILARAIMSEATIFCRLQFALQLITRMPEWTLFSLASMTLFPMHTFRNIAWLAFNHFFVGRGRRIWRLGESSVSLCVKRVRVRCNTVIRIVHNALMLRRQRIITATEYIARSRVA